MRRRSWQLRTLVAVSALALAAAGCGSADPVEPDEPDAAPSEDVDATDDADAPVDGPDEPAEQPAAEPEENGEAGEDEAATEPVDLQVTAYVVAYHWGWAVFDEDGDELDVLEVPVGAEVELVAVNDHASDAIEQLPDPVAEAIGQVDWHGRAHHDVEMGRVPDPADEEGISLSEALDAAHGHGHDLDHHELMVTGIGVSAFLDSHADEPERLVFTAEDEGTHEFRCLHDCGYGHEAQRWEMLVVSA